MSESSKQQPETHNDPVKYSPEKENTQQGSLREFLESDTAIANLERLINTVMDKSHKGNNAERLTKFGIIFLIVIAIIGLSSFGKLDSSAATILGSLAGYLFGKETE